MWRGLAAGRDGLAAGRRGRRLAGRARLMRGGGLVRAPFDKLRANGGRWLALRQAQGERWWASGRTGFFPLRLRIFPFGLRIFPFGLSLSMPSE
jgi:hypothetical protein